MFWLTYWFDLHASYQTGAEICLAAYEALAVALRALVSTLSPLSLDVIRANNKLFPSAVEVKYWLDSFALSLLQNINNLLAVGVLARTRRAVLLNWKVKNLFIGNFHFNVLFGGCMVGTCTCY